MYRYCYIITFNLRKTLKGL